MCSALYSFSFLNSNGMILKPNFNQYEILFKYLIKANTLVNHAKIKKSLEFHLEGNYEKSYEILMHSIGSDFSNITSGLYEKIASLLFQLEFLG